MNRGQRPVQQNTHTQTLGADSPHGPVKAPGQKSSSAKDKSKLARVAYVAFLGAITVLVIAVLMSLVFAKNVSSREEAYIKKDQFQAVFLNGGQVYFGKIIDLNSRYLSMGNIYYLRVNQQVQPDQQNAASANDISLVKLGCELHGPEDAMVINREQIIFWENLKNDGQVAKAVAEYVKANPNGQNCEQQNNSGGENTNTNNTPTPTTTTPPATNTNNTNRPPTGNTGR